MTIWDKEQILADVVLTIRRFKPDVIICRFPTTGEGGHGHHTASAILAMEAFDAAADPTRFPEQLKETEVWQAKRILWNTFNFGGNNTTSPNQLKIDVGGFNPMLGLSYGEMAAMSRTMHKSQGFGSAMQRGENIEYFKVFLKGSGICIAAHSACKKGGVEKGLFMAVENCLTACCTLSYTPAKNYGTNGGSRCFGKLFPCFVRYIGACVKLCFARCQVHGKGKTGWHATLLAVGLGKEFEYLYTG